MKTNTERFLILTERWATCAIAFGIGHYFDRIILRRNWMLSYLKSGVALIIALALVSLGAFAKLIAHSRLQRLYEAAAGDSRDKVVGRS